MLDTSKILIPDEELPKISPQLLCRQISEAILDLDREKLPAKFNLIDWAIRNIRLKGGEKVSLEGRDYMREIFEVFSWDNPEGMYQIKAAVISAAQMGKSVLGICAGFAACDIHIPTTITYFPAQDDAYDYSDDRIKTTLYESPYLLSQLESKYVDNKGLKQFMAKSAITGIKTVKSSWYLRGLGGKTKAKSVPGDFLIFEEVDDSDPILVESARKRLSASKYKWELEISNPSISDFGIDLDFKGGTQEYWAHICPKCGKENLLELIWAEEKGPAMIAEKDSRTFLICSCGTELTSCEKRWRPLNPGAPYRSFSLSQLFSSTVSLAEIIDEYGNARHLPTFSRLTIGIPTDDALASVSESEVFACCRDYEIADRAHGCAMGVDIGDELHIEISRFENGIDKTVWLGTRKLSGDPEKPAFSELDSLMEHFDVSCCVIDAMPYKDSARKFAARHRGRVFMCYYDEHRKGGAHFDEKEYVVSVDRTESLDASLADIKEQRKRLPRRGHPEVDLYAKHISNLRVDEEEDPETGKIKRRYIRRGADHFGHANNYRKLAASYIGTHSMVVSSIVTTRAEVEEMFN